MKELAETYRRFAERECKDYSSAYYRLALEVSEDAEILEFVAQQPVPQPNLLFAAVQYLTGPKDMPLAADSFRAFLHERGGEVGALMRIRRTQTNEAGVRLCCRRSQLVRSPCLRLGRAPGFAFFSTSISTTMGSRRWETLNRLYTSTAKSLVVCRCQR